MHSDQHILSYPITFIQNSSQNLGISEEWGILCKLKRTQIISLAINHHKWKINQQWQYSNLNAITTCTVKADSLTNRHLDFKASFKLSWGCLFNRAWTVLNQIRTIIPHYFQSFAFAVCYCNVILNFFSFPFLYLSHVNKFFYLMWTEEIFKSLNLFPALTL